ncbi:MAG: diguanylate cyclase [Desulfobulbus sp.]
MESRNKVLIIDDEPANIKILAEALRAEYETLFATNGERGLRLAVEQLPDLILLDIMMPGIDGYAVCRALKADNRIKNIPVIFITARSQLEDELHGLSLGAVDYITKPFQAPIVKARVRTHLDLKRKYDLLESLAALDGLTEIANRRRFDEALEEEWSRCLRSLLPLSLVMMDIDFFKPFNDHYGHTTGDDCLRRVARAIKRCLPRGGDLAARYGGEEFVGLLPETDSKGTLEVAERLRNAVDQLNIPHERSSVADHITMSLGVATTVPSNKKDHLVLVKSADARLYQAKANGRNQVVSEDIDTMCPPPNQRLR